MCLVFYITYKHFSQGLYIVKMLFCVLSMTFYGEMVGAKEGGEVEKCRRAWSHFQEILLFSTIFSNDFLPFFRNFFTVCRAVLRWLTRRLPKLSFLHSTWPYRVRKKNPDQKYFFKISKTFSEKYFFKKKSKIFKPQKLPIFRMPPNPT